MTQKNAPAFLLSENDGSNWLGSLADKIDELDDFSLTNGQLVHGKRNQLFSASVELSVHPINTPDALNDYRQLKMSNNPALENLSCLGVGFGEHVGTGIFAPPLLVRFLKTLMTLGRMAGANYLAWQPAEIMCDFEYFCKLTQCYIDGGPFPVWSLIRFKSDASDVFTSSGLDWICGQEMSVRGAGLDNVQMMKRLARIAHDMAVNGAIRHSIKSDGMEAGEQIYFNPAPFGKIVEIRIQSKMDQN